MANHTLEANSDATAISSRRCKTVDAKDQTADSASAPRHSPTVDRADMFALSSIRTATRTKRASERLALRGAP